MDISNKSEAWLEGISAYETGVPREANPYSSGETTTAEAFDWFGGWDLAQVILSIKKAS